MTGTPCGKHMSEPQICAHARALGSVGACEAVHERPCIIKHYSIPSHALT